MVKNKTLWWLSLVVLGIAPMQVLGQQPAARLELIPPSPVTDKIVLDIRGAVENNGDSDQQYKLSLYLDRESGATLLHSEVVKIDRKSTRLNSSHQIISYAVFCLKKKKHNK